MHCVTVQWYYLVLFIVTQYDLSLFYNTMCLIRLNKSYSIFLCVVCFLILLH